jgi:hypothetical protein
MNTTPLISFQHSAHMATNVSIRALESNSIETPDAQALNRALLIVVDDLRKENAALQAQLFDAEVKENKQRSIAKRLANIALNVIIHGTFPTNDEFIACVAASGKSKADVLAEMQGPLGIANILCTPIRWVSALMSR